MSMILHLTEAKTISSTILTLHLPKHELSRADNHQISPAFVTKRRRRATPCTYLQKNDFLEHIDNIPLLNVIFETFSISYNVMDEGVTVCGHPYRPFVL